MALKVTDLFLGEKNFIDFVDKNLGQEKDRLKSDELEKDTVCQHLRGGVLDYPIMISHDFADITTAIDVYMEAFMRDAKSKIPKEYAYGVFKRDTERNYRLGKMPFRGDELTVKQFINAMLSACPKLRNHIIECMEEATSTGRLENLYVIISNVVFVRNYIWTFLEFLEADNLNKLKTEYKQFCELAEVLSEQMLQIFGNLLTTYILHDEQSQSFSSHQPYYEGERGSPVIPMWSYFIKGIQRDMWSTMPPQLSQRILGIMVNDSLAILCARYTQLRPTEATVPQYASDIINILTVVQELLFYISTDLASCCGQINPSVSKTIFSIHTKCHCLASTLILVGSPLEVLYKNFRRGLSACKLLETRQESLTCLSDPPWVNILTSLCPSFHPRTLSQSDWELNVCIKLVSCGSSSNWPLVYKAIVMNNCKLAKTLLALFATDEAPVSHYLLEGHGFERCKGAACMDALCHGLPPTLPNNHVSTCATYIVANALSWEALPKLFRPVFCNVSSWNVMDKTQIWTSKTRPVWFLSLIDIILPVLKTCVQSLILVIADWVAKHQDVSQTPAASSSASSGRKGSISALLNVSNEKEEEVLTQWVIELLNTVTEVLSIIPRGFFMVCEELDDLIPRVFIPVRNNVPLHFLVTSLYMLLNLGSDIINSIIDDSKNEEQAQASASDQKSSECNPKEPATLSSSATYLEPCLFSTAERLCYLDNPVFDQVVHRMVTQIESMVKHTKANHDKSVISLIDIEEFSLDWDVANLKADYLMENSEGQLAMKTIYWFLVTHGTAVEELLRGEEKDPGQGVPQRQSSKPPNVDKAAVNSSMRSISKVGPKTLTSFPQLRVIHDFHYINKYRTFDEIIWNYREIQWVPSIRQCPMGLQKHLISKLLERRWEFAASQDSELKNSKDEKDMQLLRMVSEIQALL